MEFNKSISLAPIALFVYNRLWHTRQTVDALRNNQLASKSDLIIFSDAPKSDIDKGKVKEVREFIKQIQGFKSIRLVESRINKGLADSIISGVSSILRISDNVIVLEDDLITSRYFLSYMNQALDIYKNEDKVISIHAYVYPVKIRLPETFFLRGADCWGWATWKRGWALFESDGAKLLAQLKKEKLLYDFDLENSYSFSNMLSDQTNGKNDSWAVRWHAAAFLKNKLTLYPGVSFVSNIGLDNSGTHSGSSNDFDVNMAKIEPMLERIPIEVNTNARKAFANYLSGVNESLIRKIIRKIKQFLGYKSWSR